MNALSAGARPDALSCRRKALRVEFHAEFNTSRW